MRYYFDIFDGDHWTRDDLGVDCESDRRARHQAVLALTEMASELLPSDGATKTIIIRVRRKDEVAFTVQLAFDTSPGPALSDRSIAEEQKSLT